MASDFDGKGNFINEDSALRGLAYELKNPLINIARQAELNEANSHIQQTAEQALMLIDSYLLNAQTEYGQVMLDLEPASVGSVFYDVSIQLRPQAEINSTEILIDERMAEPVMTHKKALASVLAVFGNALMSNTENRQVYMRSYKAKNGKLGVGIFGKAKITQSDIDSALNLQGRAHMPLSKVSQSSHVSLAIGEGLCRAIGGKMSVKRIGKLSGLATELPVSEQLAFI